ncbi:MAG TPA: glycine zipper 2TM domain-containing protein [Ideonella sp.]|nr:glycine zipper 2TM domain-containing protein [Ideonella sp.]
MHPSTASVRPRPASSSAGLPKGAWVALGLMAVAIVSLAAALVWRQAPSPEFAQAVVSADTETAAPTAADSPQRAVNAPQETAGAKPPPVQGTRPAPVTGAKPATAPSTAPSTAPGSTTAPAMSSAGDSSPPATQQAVVSVCNSCGIVEAVEPVKREGKASGVGAVGGAVVGGAVGNRFGAGSGKTAMTVIGAIGGGLAGNAIEKHAKSETVYRMKVRMEDGTVRSVTQAKSVAVGSHVTVQGETLKVTAPPAQSQTPAGSQVARASNQPA